MVLRTVFRSMFRSKRSRTPSHDLSACLSTLDLTSLGIGSILGAGTYVVAGQVAKSVAGPAVILSFTIAAFASLLSGLCYAEFGARVPKTTGSAYAYSYRTVGQFTAYIIGWNLILEYMIGTAADARALSGSIDFLTGNKIREFIIDYIGRVPVTEGYPDLLGFTVTVIITLVLAIGVKTSANYTLVFNALNVFLVLLVVIVGLFYVDTNNWNGADKFFPYGAHGVFAGAASCFYAFVGFDIIATTGAEAKTPSRSIPIAIMSTLVICYIAYIGVASVTTLIAPVTSLTSDAPLAESFDVIGVHWAKYIVGLGAVFGLASSLLGSMFPLPRIIYAMASDGLLFSYFTKVNLRSETPVRATILPGLVTALFTMLFDLAELVEMMSIGTLLAYTLVCLSVLILRYQKCDDNPQVNGSAAHDHSNLHLRNGCANMDDIRQSPSEIRARCGESERLEPNDASSRKVVISTIVLTILFLVFSLIMTYAALRPLTFVLLALVSGLILVCVIVITAQPQDTKSASLLSFKVPLVPWLPLISVFMNISLMVRLTHITWIRFIVWLSLGLILYFTYGMKHATAKLDGELATEDEMLLMDNRETAEDVEHSEFGYTTIPQ